MINHHRSNSKSMANAMAGVAPLSWISPSVGNGGSQRLGAGFVGITVTTRTACFHSPTAIPSLNYKLKRTTIRFLFFYHFLMFLIFHGLAGNPLKVRKKLYLMVLMLAAQDLLGLQIYSETQTFFSFSFSSTYLQLNIAPS